MLRWIFWLSKVSGCNKICIRRICSDQSQKNMIFQIDKQVTLRSKRIFLRDIRSRRFVRKPPWLRFYIVLCCVLYCYIVLCCVALYCIIFCCCGLLGHWLCIVLHCAVLWYCGSSFSLFCIALCCGVVWYGVVSWYRGSGFSLLCIVFHCVVLGHKIGFTLVCTVSRYKSSRNATASL